MDDKNLIFLFLFILGSFSEEYGKYSEQDKWGGECKTGKKQSPINICRCRAKKDETKTLKRLEYDFKSDNFTPVMLTYRNEKLKLSFYLYANTPLIKLPDKDEPYKLEEWLIHFPSEHKIDGKQYDMEFQFTYIDQKYRWGSKALEANDTIAALSFLVKFSDDEKGPPILDQLNNQTKIIYRIGGISGAKLDGLSALFPKRASYFTYYGSDTHSCEEGFQWYVFEEPLTISTEQGNELMEFYNQDGTKLTNNARHTQPLNCRRVIYFQDSQN